MAIPEPHCNDGPNELLRKILLGLPFIGSTIGGPPNGPAGGTLGGTYPNPTIATGGSGNFTPGSVIFAGATGGLAEDNANLFWDDTNNLFLAQSVNFPVSRFVRTSAATSGASAAIMVKKLTSNAVVIDGFGGGIQFAIQSSALAEQNVAAISGVRDGADNSGAIEFYTHLLGVSVTADMVIKSTGNVGIGELTPDVRLHVNAGSQTGGVYGDAGTAIKITATNDASSVYGGIVWEDTTSGGTETFGLYNIRAGGINQFSITNNQVEYLVIDSVAGFKFFPNAVNAVNFTGTGAVANTLNVVTGLVGIRTVTPLSLLTIVGDDATDVQIHLGNTETNAVAKFGGISAYQFNNTADPEGYAVINYLAGSAAVNEVIIGGGISAKNAATLISFYTAANSTTRTGTERMRINELGNVGIGTAAPNANALLDVSSTTKAFMPPRMTTAQKNAIAAPTAGMVVYDSTLAKLAVYTTVWEAVTST